VIDRISSGPQSSLAFAKYTDASFEDDLSPEMQKSIIRANPYTLADYAVRAHRRFPEAEKRILTNYGAARRYLEVHPMWPEFDQKILANPDWVEGEHKENAQRRADVTDLHRELGHRMDDDNLNQESVRWLVGDYASWPGQRAVLALVQDEDAGVLMFRWRAGRA